MWIIPESNQSPAFDLRKHRILLLYFTLKNNQAFHSISQLQGWIIVMVVDCSLKWCAKWVLLNSSSERQLDRSFLILHDLLYNSHTTSTLGSKCLRIMHTNMDWVISKLTLDDSWTTTVVPKGLIVLKKHSIGKHK